MLDIGWSEIFVIAIVAIVVIGPKELPSALRTLGGMLAKVRKMAGEFQGQFQQVMKEAELGDVHKEFSEIRQSVSALKGGIGMSPTELVRKEIGGAITGSPPAPPAPATAPPPTIATIESLAGPVNLAPAGATTTTTVAAEPEPPVFIPSAYAPSLRFR